MKFHALLATAAMIAAAPAFADTYPSKPVRIIVGYTAGGTSDIVARVVAQELTAMNGQTFIVENRAGVGGMLGANIVAKSKPDGYVLGLGVSGTLVTGPHLVKEKLYDPLTAFEPISMIARSPLVILTATDSSIDSIATLIKEAKAHPGEVTFASNAQLFELAMQLFNFKTGIKVSVVPYPGAAQGAMDVMTKRVQIMVDTYGAQKANIDAGKLRVLAIMSSQRSALVAGAPTVAESGVPGFEASGWMNIVAPKGTPANVVAKLNGQLRQIMQKPSVVEKMNVLAFEPSTGTAAELDALIRDEYEKWGAVVKAAGLQPQ